MAKRVLYVLFAPGMDGCAISLSLLVKNLDRRRYVPLTVQTSTELGSVAMRFADLNVSMDHVPVPLIWSYSWLSEANVRGRAWRAFRTSVGAERYLQELKPDLVHLTCCPPVPFAIAADNVGIPIVWHCRTVISNGSLFSPAPRIIAEMKRRARRIIAISEPEAAQFDGDALRMIYNPVEIDQIERARGTGVAIRKEFGVAADEFVVVAPIALTTNKGAFDFIRACGAASRRAPSTKFHFFIVGGIPTPGRRHLLRRWVGLGPETELDRANRLIHEEGLETTMHVTGFRRDVYAFMDAADLVAFPTRLNTCGRIGFEAGAMGKPVIVTMRSPETRVVLDGRTGRILRENSPEELAQAIAWQAAHPEEGRRMGESGREYVLPRFSESAHVQSVMSLYDEVLKESASLTGEGPS
jgi:glycosyltransferase involved in cell wall biosynthesis